MSRRRTCRLRFSLWPWPRCSVCCSQFVPPPRTCLFSTSPSSCRCSTAPSSMVAMQRSSAWRECTQKTTHSYSITVACVAQIARGGIWITYWHSVYCKCLKSFRLRKLGISPSLCSPVLLFFFLLFDLSPISSLCLYAVFHRATLGSCTVWSWLCLQCFLWCSTPASLWWMGSFTETLYMWVHDKYLAQLLTLPTYCGL